MSSPLESPYITNEQEKEYDQLVYKAVQKAVQIVIQSRCNLGQNKKATALDLETHGGSQEWFSIDIRTSSDQNSDSQKSQLKSKDYYKSTSGLWVEQGKYNTTFIGIRVDIFDAQTRKTVESWFFQVNKGMRNRRGFTDSYLRISNLLKSLLVVSRLSFGYQLAKDFENDSYLSYKITSCPEQRDINHQIGQIACPVGQLCFYYENYESSYYQIDTHSIDDESSDLETSRDWTHHTTPSNLGSPPQNIPLSTTRAIPRNISNSSLTSARSPNFSFSPGSHRIPSFGGTPYEENRPLYRTITKSPLAEAMTPGIHIRSPVGRTMSSEYGSAYRGASSLPIRTTHRTMSNNYEQIARMSQFASPDLKNRIQDNLERSRAESKYLNFTNRNSDNVFFAQSPTLSSEKSPASSVLEISTSEKLQEFINESSKLRTKLGSLTTSNDEYKEILETLDEDMDGDTHLMNFFQVEMKKM